MRDQIIKDAKRLVLKVGSRLVASKGSGLNTERIDQLASELATLKAQGREIVMVSSGAIVCGIEKLGLPEYPKSLPHKQAAAAVGQSRLMWAYEKAFEKVDQKVAQVLLTREDLANRARFLNSRHTLTALLEYGVVPIINENDTVAVDEIRFGDNDSLAGMVAHLVDADLLVILSDVEGLYTEDPRHNPNATLIPVVTEVTAEIERRAGGTTSFEGTGGMHTKVLAAKKAATYGIATAIVSGERTGPLAALFHGHPVGTLFLPKSQKLTSRKHWIGYTVKAKGRLTLDDGAVEALTRKGKSLLPSGITAVHGDFESGDAVACVDNSGREFAKGLANYSSEAIGKIKGLKTSEIQKTLGYKDYDEVIHRDNLVIL
jgi:glutamate 5-kinase